MSPIGWFALRFMLGFFGGYIGGRLIASHTLTVATGIVLLIVWVVAIWIITVELEIHG